MNASTRMPPLFRRLFPVILVFAMAAVAGRAELLSTFSNLGYLPTGGVNGMSANGQVIYGYTSDLYPDTHVDRTHIWRFTADGWQLSYLDNDDFLITWANAISADASTVVGRANHHLINVAALWHYENNQWVRTELDSGGLEADATAVSDDGQVVIGTVRNEYGSESGRVWEHINGAWIGSALIATDGSRTFMTALSHDGSIIISNHALSPRGFEPMVWMRGNDGWHYTVLPSDASSIFNSAKAMSADGWSILGETTVKGDSRIVVWNFDGGTWKAHILPQFGTGYAFASGISADGTVVIGDSSSNPNSSMKRVVWELKNNQWVITRSGGLSENDGNVQELAADGKLCIAENSSMPPRLWNLLNGNLITAAELVAGVDQNNSSAGWDFSDAIVQNIGYDSVTNSYNIIGYAQYEGHPTYWAVAVYTPFLTEGTVFVGQEIDATLPDHNEGEYQVSKLPAGLAYDAKTRKVSGRATKEGIFPIQYRSHTGKTRQSLLKVVPLPAQMTGVQTLPLAGANVGDPSPGVLNVKIGPTGSLSGSLKLNGSPKAQTLKLSGMMIVESSGKFSAAYASKTATTPGITLKLGKGTSLVQFQLSLHMSRDGILIAELRDTNNNLIGTATSD
ncbi:MAG TPA: hypothetical protein VL357_10720 [Rariglobus sp.]|jgi:uncharacterized membrane protein|nr:hypothetical protein [Rariglobus sp.]